MASYRYLWKNRARFPVGSINFLRAWAKRIQVIRLLLESNSRRNKLVSKGAEIDETAEIGDVDIGGRKELLSIGSFSTLGKVQVALHGRVSIGDNVCINDGVQILTGSHDVHDPLWRHVVADVYIDDFVWIGTNAIILPGVKLNRGCVIGAGAVVTKNVDERAVVVGNPARPISKKRCENLAYNPCEFLAGNRAWLVG